MDVQTCIHTVRAVRAYRDEPVPESVIQTILVAGRATGSGKNRQPWKFILVQDRTRLRELAKTGTFAAHLAEAAFAVVIVIDRDAPNGLFDAGRATQNMILAAHARGVSSCPVSLHQAAAARALLEVPEDKTIAIGIAFGYRDRDRAAEERAFRKRVLERQGRLPLDQLVVHERYAD
mgnify:CR=1 FL=1